MNDQNFKNLCLKVFILENFENARKNIMKSTNFFLFLFYTELKTLECDILNPDLLTSLKIKFMTKNKLYLIWILRKRVD